MAKDTLLTGQGRFARDPIKDSRESCLYEKDRCNTKCFNCEHTECALSLCREAKDQAHIALNLSACHKERGTTKNISGINLACMSELSGDEIKEIIYG